MSNDMNISPISYTNKDFRAIYEELLDLVNDLTSRWDPKSTNESDPGLVLLKLKAFIADKLNYNIDKNTLENFPSQATQRGNAQKLYDILGYGMKYYQSATTEVTLRYRAADGMDLGGITQYSVPAFTQLTDDSGRISYVTTENATISTDLSNRTKTTVPVIEGVVQNFVINGSSLITVDNLDSDYRLYFTETRIAQNGIYINSEEDNTYWGAVDNLEATQLGQKVFKFGVLPNTNTCYLEFPQDAATLFGNGINIKYVITSGVEGNIGFGVLSSITNSLIDPDKDSIDYKKCTLVIQPGSATNGKDPESLREAYKNCKRTINTFNTLITTKDYENALLNSGVVSNCVVSDRTNDISRSYKVVSKTKDGDGVTYLNTMDGANPSMSAFDIALYTLSPVNSIEDSDSFNKSFQTHESTTTDAQYTIEKYKSIQHNYKNISNIDSPFIYKNLVSLEGKVLTYQKVTEAEAKEIESNINKNLYKNYNSKMIEFGQELDYNSLIENVKNSDDRIKTVILEYPEYSINQMDYQNGLKNLVPPSKAGDTISVGESEADIIAKSILAGVTPYCIFDSNEKLDFTMTEVTKADSVTINDDGDIIDYSPGTTSKATLSESTFGDDTNGHIARITTSTVLSKGVTLKENENVFCVGPSFVSKAQLSTCLYYALITGNEDKLTTSVSANSYYILGEDDYLLVSEGITENGKLDFSSGKKTWIYSGNSRYRNMGSIIHPTMNIEFKSKPSDSDWKIVDPSDNLGTSDTIEILSDNTVRINEDKTIFAVWSCDNLYNQLFDTTVENIEYLNSSNEVVSEDDADKVQFTKLLQNNDVFIYTDENKQDLMLLGSGTELIIRAPLASISSLYAHAHYTGKPWTMSNINISNINTHGVNASLNWNKIPGNIEFLVSEKQIITLGEKVTLNWSAGNWGDDGNWDQSPSNEFKITNKHQIVPQGFKYIYEGESSDSSLPTIEGSGSDSYGWKIFSRLSLVLSPTQGQKLLCDEDGKRVQAVTLYKAVYAEDANGKKVVNGYEYLKKDSSTPSSPSLPLSTLTGGYYITSNNAVALSGGVQQDSLVMTQDGIEDTLTFYVAGKNANDNVEILKNWEQEGDPKYLLSGKNSNGIIYFSGALTNNKLNCSLDRNSAVPVYVESSGSNQLLYWLDNGVKKYFKFNATEGSFTLTAINATAFTWDSTLNTLKSASGYAFGALETDTINQLSFVSTSSQGYNWSEFLNLLFVNHVDTSIVEEEDYSLISIIRKDPNSTETLDGSLTLTLSPRFDNSLIPILALSEDDGCTLKISNNNDDGTTIEYEGVEVQEDGITLKGNQYPVYVKLKETVKVNDKGTPSIPDDDITIYPTNLTLKLELSNFKKAANIYVFNPLKIKSFSEYLGAKIKDENGTLTDNTIKNLIKVKGTLNSKNIFNYSYQVEEENLISNPLDPESFFNSNHIGNKYTIAQLNTGKNTSTNTPYIDIKVASQSLQSRRK